MKKNVSKKVLCGAATLAFLTGGLVTYAGTELVWGGEADVAKVSSVLDSLKDEVFNKGKKITNSEKALAQAKEESEDLKTQIEEKSEEISAMDSMREKLEAEITSLNESLNTQHQTALDRENQYKETMEQMDKDYQEQLAALGGGEENEEKFAKLQEQVKQIQFEKEVLESNIAKLNLEKSTLEGKLNGAIEDSKAADSEVGKARQDVKGLREKAEQVMSDLEPDMAK